MKDDALQRPLRLELHIDGMLAVHARHAVYTALAGVRGVRRADVELGRAEVELASEPGAEASAEAVVAQAEPLLREALEVAGCSLRALRLLPRTLPTWDGP